MIAFLCIPLAAACASSRIRRTDLTSWKSVPVAGGTLIVDVPRGVHHVAGGRYLSMHSRSNGIADSSWWIEISVRDKLPEYPSHGYPSRSESFNQWARWLSEYHPETSALQLNSSETHYRRDVRTARGVASIHATYRAAPFTPEERAEDDRAIRRILDSARPAG